MRQSTAHPPTGEDLDQRPPDVEVMRASTALLLDPDGVPEALPPAADELATLTEAIRGHLELIGPEVARAAGRLDKESIPRYCAIACVGEARGKLRAAPGPGQDGAVAYARRLARVLNALCDHWENLHSTGAGADQ
ncbi:DUF6415 family natural product biosynthesis protein [Streptomyces sp. NBC_00280]|uniref:DUF6415 family natural product biosynthesis protein n=1 Tax=Streptomyces sp. NBC_00280 TaxID=2975699 RepID=UPI003249BB86